MSNPAKCCGTCCNQIAKKLLFCEVRRHAFYGGERKLTPLLLVVSRDGGMHGCSNLCRIPNNTPQNPLLRSLLTMSNMCNSHLHRKKKGRAEFSSIAKQKVSPKAFALKINLPRRDLLCGYLVSRCDGLSPYLLSADWLWGNMFSSAKSDPEGPYALLHSTFAQAKPLPRNP